VFSRYHISGELSDTFFYDVVGTNNCQNGSMAAYWYDARGLPLQAQIQNCVYGPTIYSYLTNARNVAGLVTKRYSVPGNAPITYVESNWGYDTLGRVTSQIVKKGTAFDQVARQDLSYYGNDDPKSLDQWLGASNQKQFTFRYDERHQLTHVDETANAFSANYTYGDAGRFRHAFENISTPVSTPSK
jgi:hypothetical protein